MNGPQFGPRGTSYIRKNERTGQLEEVKIISQPSVQAGPQPYTQNYPPYGRPPIQYPDYGGYVLNDLPPLGYGSLPGPAGRPNDYERYNPSRTNTIKSEPNVNRVKRVYSQRTPSVRASEVNRSIQTTRNRMLTPSQLKTTMVLSIISLVINPLFVAFLMWHCAVSERRKDNDGRAMQYSSISKGLAITGIVFTFVVALAVMVWYLFINVKIPAVESDYDIIP